ncbi:copper-resistance protein, CopA family [Enhydrobacter aerosaccus]|uniref:Copper-resistance protein, CopA family n=1 Tax=Enhydrobacter aerosaccus TaxID=225324 RepID=A0A1T4JNU8_9HYPH|nr:copper resistance system multicopper oxidase [Enhydrobacter aerosaccus]SJZ31747.1 copper-resistance protein, CopA family [Enhydrobacter aerosaccus]
MKDTASNPGPRLGRRRFVEGLALTAGLASVGASRGHAADYAPGPTTLTGDRFDLVVASTAVNFTGRARTATTVNGSVPAPILRFREGDTVTLNVTNRLSEPTSIHWHGLILPNAMDGVPGLTFRGIMPGQTFAYRFPIRQAGTYWYHSHSGMQEQTGLYGPLILEPRRPEPYSYQRDYVVMLSDWTDDDPMTVVSNLKQQSDYYNYGQRTLGTFIKDARRDGLGATIDDRMMWGQMRMSPTDLMDVSGATYTFLMNGRPPAANWTGLFRRGERVRLRFINGSSMSTFDIRIPGLAMTVVQADGSDVEPIEIEEFRIGVAETYDVIVTPMQDAYTIFAQAMDRSGYARGTLCVREGLAAPIPPLDPRPQLSMVDMGMGGMDHAMSGSGHAGHDAGGAKSAPAMDMSHMDMSHMSPEELKQHMAMMAAAAPVAPSSDTVPTSNADGIDPASLAGQPSVDNVAMQTRDRLGEAGIGLDGNGRRTLTYRDLRALHPVPSSAPPTRALEFHLTGNMQRYMWGFDGRKFSQAGPIRVARGERIRFVLINDTMMEHPIHLHGYLFELENGQGDRLPLKHTIRVKPAERLSFVFTADMPGHWAFHCHLLFHMDAGMFRTILVS